MLASKFCAQLAILYTDALRAPAASHSLLCRGFCIVSILQCSMLVYVCEVASEKGAGMGMGEGGVSDSVSGSVSMSE